MTPTDKTIRSEIEEVAMPTSAPLVAPSSKRLLSIDFLRGIAALAVVGHHAITYGTEPNVRWFNAIAIIFRQGYLGVPLFFVISGFCIHLSWARQKASGKPAKVNWFGFWKRRIHRLYPPYFVALVFSIALVVVAYALHRDVTLVSFYPVPKGRWIAIDFVVHVFMLHGFVPLLDKMGGNPPFWTLAREEYLYALYAALLLLRRRLGLNISIWTVVALGMAFPLAFLPFLPHQSPWWETVINSPVVLWIEWAVGMVAVEAYFGIVKLPAFAYWPWLALVWGAFGKFLELKGFYSVAPVFWALCFVTLVNYCVRREQRGRWFNGKIAAWFTGVGVFSYSLYLVHYPVRALAKQALGPLNRTVNPALYLLNAFVMAIAGYWAGKAMFQLVERRFLNAQPERQSLK
jgi:peptidoglycan/LPS O-acetylase OafA/YrhL